MPPDVLLRPASGEDVDRVAAIRLAARRDAPMPLPVAADEGLDVELARVWVAEAPGGDLVAYARFTEVWLEDLYVLPSAQGEGIGTALLDVVKAHCPGGFGLWVFATNQPARSFYAGRGLVELEHTDGSTNPEGEPDIRVVWPGEDPMAGFRRLIDEIDLALGDLLARRAALTHAVQDHKRRTLQVADPGRDAVREAAVVQRVLGRVPALGQEAVARIMHAIITESIRASR